MIEKIAHWLEVSWLTLQVGWLGLAAAVWLWLAAVRIVTA